MNREEQRADAIGQITAMLMRLETTPREAKAIADMAISRGRLTEDPYDELARQLLDDLSATNAKGVVEVLSKRLREVARHSFQWGAYDVLINRGEHAHASTMYARRLGPSGCPSFSLRHGPGGPRDTPVDKSVGLRVNDDLR